MTYKLYLDDVRNPPDNSWVIARSSAEALQLLDTLGMPVYMALDHDLGADDRTMDFLKALTVRVQNGSMCFPKDFSFSVHSSNPDGAANITSYLNSLIKSLE